MNDEPRPRDALVAHLTTDFKDPEKRQVLDDPNVESSSLKAFVARMTSPEDIEERLTSEESARLGVEVEGLLEGAHITGTFRDYIVNTVRQAHAMEDKVAEEISPERLGLNSPDESIFDEAAAAEIEARCLRDYLYAVARKYLQRAESGEDKKVIIMNPGEFDDVMAGVEQWQEAYQELHGTDPLESVDLTAYELAAQEIVMIDLSSGEPGEAEIDDMYRRFIQGLKDRQDPREGRETSE